MATCKGCGAEILWLKTMTGKTMPVDIPPEKRIVIIYDRVIGEERGEVKDSYVSHFATCPQADAFRKKEKADGK